MTNTKKIVLGTVGVIAGLFIVAGVGNMAKVNAQRESVQTETVSSETKTPDSLVENFDFLAEHIEKPSDNTTYYRVRNKNYNGEKIILFVTPEGAIFETGTAVPKNGDMTLDGNNVYYEGEWLDIKTLTEDMDNYVEIETYVEMYETWEWDETTVEKETQYYNERNTFNSLLDN